MRPGEMIDLGDRVFVQLRGKRLERLGAKGFDAEAVPDHRRARRQGRRACRDYARREDALAAAGLKRVAVAGGGVLRSRPDAAAPLVGARARRLVPRARADLAPPAREGGRVAAPVRRCAARATRRCGAAPRTGCSCCAASRRSELRELVAEALEPVLRPLVYAEPLLPGRAAPRSAASRVYIVSATLQEIVQAIADDLGFDGALGTVCEVRDGAYTGRALRALHAENKAQSRARAGREPRASTSAECTAYSDSHTDLPFLEAVGHPVAVNPDRELRRIAAERGWPVLEFSAQAYPHARRRVPPLVWLAGALFLAGALAAGRRRGG